MPQALERLAFKNSECYHAFTPLPKGPFLGPTTNSKEIFLKLLSLNALHFYTPIHIHLHALKHKVFDLSKHTISNQYNFYLFFVGNKIT